MEAVDRHARALRASAPLQRRLEQMPQPQQAGDAGGALIERHPEQAGREARSDQERHAEAGSDQPECPHP